MVKSGPAFCSCDSIFLKHFLKQPVFLKHSFETKTLPRFPLVFSDRTGVVWASSGISSFLVGLARFTIARHEVQLLMNRNYNKIREEYGSGINYLTGWYLDAEKDNHSSATSARLVTRTVNYSAMTRTTVQLMLKLGLVTNQIGEFWYIKIKLRSQLRWSWLTWFQIRSAIYETFHISLHIHSSRAH